MTAKEPIAVEILRKLLTYTEETGAVKWRVSVNSRAQAGTEAGMVDVYGYRRLTVMKHRLQAHRVAWALHYGEWPTSEVDHINGVRSDNRLSNLRSTSRTKNMQNQRRAMATNRTGLLGVSARRGGFCASIQVDGAKLYLGDHATSELAHAAYLTAKRELHPGCTI